MVWLYVSTWIGCSNANQHIAMNTFYNVVNMYN